MYKYTDQSAYAKARQTWFIVSHQRPPALEAYRLNID